MKKRWIPTFLGLVLSSIPATGEELLRQHDWTSKAPVAGTVLPPSDDRPAPSLEIRRTESGPATIPLWSLDSPPISSSRYALAGEVRYEGVEGEAFLEMWSVFEGEERYFSRTLADEGPMAKLRGSSPWRRALIPFFNREGGPPPSRLELNLVLPGRGTVWIGPLRLVQYGPGEDPLAAAAGAWWTDRQAGLIGAFAGTLLGIGGAIAGAAAARGRARRFAIGFLAAVLTVGGLTIGAGVIALALGQPRSVTFTLLLLGGLCAGIAGPQLPRLRRLYEQAELRRMQAHDVR